MTTNFSKNQLNKLVLLLTKRIISSKKNFIKRKEFTVKEYKEFILEICRGKNIILGDFYLPLVVKYRNYILQLYENFL
jgi:hypothetical protein